MPKPEMPEMVRIKSSSSVSFAQMHVFFCFVGAGGPRQAERPGRPELGLVDKRMGTEGVLSGRSWGSWYQI